MRTLFFQSCCVAALCCTCVENLTAEEASNSNQNPQCTKEELLMAFPQPIVKNVLKQANFSEKDSVEIANELSKRDQGMAKLVDQKAAKYHPNPFQDLSQRDQALKIYQETLFEVFANVLKEHDIKDEHQIRTLLDEIRSKKSKMFIDCIRNQATLPPKKSEAGSSKAPQFSL